jgi:NTE family protein
MPSRALVLSGGGSVGIAWESGIVAGLAEGGVHLGDADLIVGTSAGSVVGAQLALGRSPEAILASQLQPRPAPAAPPGRAPGPPDLGPLMEIMGKLYAGDADAEALRREIGAFALSAKTAPEEQFIAGFGQRIGSARDWPERFVCTAVDAATGEFVRWDRAAGVDLARAVASSCAVPGIFPPITIGGRRYMDGGMRSGTNADLAAGCEVVVIVTLMGGGAPAGDPRLEAAHRRLETEVAALRAAGARAVEILGPDEGSRAAFGLNLMDGRQAPAAAREGLRQGRAEAPHLRDVWSKA